MAKSMNDLLNDANRRIRQLQEKLHSTEEALEAWKTEAAELGDQVQALQASAELLEQQEKTIDNLQFHNRGLQSEIDALKAHVERLRFIADTEYADEDERIADIQDVLESTPQQNLAEQHPDDEAVNKFAYQMKCKLAIA